MTNPYILIPLLLLGFFLFGQVRDPLKYKFLFRNTILSKSKKYELAAVLRGRVYYPRYFYIPALKQYIVYSNVDETGSFRVYKNTGKSMSKVYSLLDENGTIMTELETTLSFSNRSGSFYGPNSYIPFLETGKKDLKPYDQIYNAALDINKRDFEKLFVELYTSSEYIEYVNLRSIGDQIHQAGMIFKRQGKIEILLSGVRNPHMVCNSVQDRLTNNFEDYYLPNILKVETFPQSKPSIETISLETDNSNPFMYWRTGFNREFKIEKYKTLQSEGLHGVGKVGCIPLYVFGESSGTAYVRFKSNGEIFRIKVLEVPKISFLPGYNLGLRTFKLPKNIRTETSLVFMESMQNSRSNRMGGGVFVVRPAKNKNPSSDIPSDMTEKYFNTLPLTLQEALLHPNEVTSLKIIDKNSIGWIPELERLINLTHLELSITLKELPDAISKFSKLQQLSLADCNIETISTQLGKLTELTELNLSSNKLTEFPPEILELKKLEKLNLNYNRISTLPDNISALKQLEYLNIEQTNIKDLPESMIGMDKLFIIDRKELEDKLPQLYKHLFDYRKTLPDYIRE